MKHYKLRPRSIAWYTVQAVKVIFFVALWYIILVLISAI